MVKPGMDSSSSYTEHSRPTGRKARLIAFYLPQFHPIPENDEWWGKGFTEWTNVAKAKRLYPGHRQPLLPADLGFYDLRLPEVRSAQAELAREAGIEGFCYWHYWFAGKRLLERPFMEVLESGKPDFPFCLAWANQTWSGIWHGAENRILMEQTYPGSEDHERHFYALLPAFRDPRYIRVHDKPLFVIYRPTEFPDIEKFIQQWQGLALKNGLKGIHFVSHLLPQNADFPSFGVGFSGETVVTALKVGSLSIRGLFTKHFRKPRNAGSPDREGAGALARIVFYSIRRIFEKLGCKPLAVYHYRDAMRFFLDGLKPDPNCYPCIVPNWDNSSRCGRRAMILHGSTPELFRNHVREALTSVRDKPPEDKIVFVKSWNEWAEGNYLEPDVKFGRGYLDVLGDEVIERSEVTSRQNADFGKSGRDSAVPANA